MGLMKDWEELAIKDNFLFQQVMRNKRLCMRLLSKILGIRIRDISYPQTEKVIEGAPLSKGIRLDVYVEDDTGTIYNIEMQTTGTAGDDTLARRIRYYGAMIDMDVMEKGQDYEMLPKRFIIFICTFDPFGRKRSIYTFQNICREEPALGMGDDTTNIFLCTNGRAEGIDPDIISFLRYVDGKAAEGEFTQDFASAVDEIKKHVKVRRDYMTLMMEMQREVKREVQREIKKEVEKERLFTLQNLINGTGWSIEKAMDILKIPADDRAKYAALLTP